MKSLLYILLLFLSPEVFAGVFDPPPTDESVRMLGLIFGSNIGNIYLGGEPNPIMSQIMEKFNFIIVVVGSAVLSYVVVLSVINTAQEGTAMGKKWSAIWVPMRSIAGMSLMVPSPGTGYSLIQQTIIWIIIQGIGAADQIWTIALEGLKNGASVTIGSTTPPDVSIPLAVDADPLIGQLAQIAICMQGIQQVSKTATSITPWLLNSASAVKPYSDAGTLSPTDPSNDPGSPTTSVTVSGNMYFGVKDTNDTDALHNATCGSVKINGIATADDFGSDYFTNQSEQERFNTLSQSAILIYDTKVLALTSMLAILQPMAQAIVEGSAKPATSNTSTQMDSSWQIGYYAAASDAYVKLMSSLIVPKESATVAANSDLASAITQGEQKGWIVAGAYYFVLNRSLAAAYYSNIHSPPVITPRITCTGSCSSDYLNGTYDLDHVPTPPASPTSGQQAVNILSLSMTQADQLDTWLATGDIYITLDKKNSNNLSLNLSSSLGGDDSNPVIHALAAAMESLQQTLYNAMTVNAGTPQGDVLLTHAELGRTMMTSMEFTWISLFGIIIILGAATGLEIPFTAGPGGLFIGMLMTAFGVVLPVIGLVWSIGAGLAIYAPLIPFMIFTVGALGWMLAVIEALVAAPLIALGLVTPAGDELGKIETALMILANIFLRPMLMIFGFFLSGRLYNAVVSLIDLGMLQVFNTINVETIFSPLIIFFAYASFVIGMTNTCFSLIYAIPDKIMRWIGGHPEQTDVSAVQQVKGAVGQASGEIGKSGSEMGSKSASATGAKAKANMEKKAEAAKAKKGG